MDSEDKKLNEVDALISSAYLNFEDEDLEIIEHSEVYLLRAYGAETLRDLGPGACGLFLSLATMWHSFPASATQADYTVSPHALSLAAIKILESDWEAGDAFPFANDEMLEGIAEAKRCSQDGDSQPLLDLVAVTLAAVNTKEKNRHKRATPPPAPADE